MAGAGGQAWTNAEKNYLLAEIIKAHGLHPNVLLNVVQNLPPNQVNWNDIPLPPGRSLNSCQSAFNELCRNAPTPFVPNIIGPQTSSPLTLGQPVKRPHSSIEGAQAPGRAIRPKIPTESMGYGPVTPAEQQPQKKRRGRPSKATIEARAQSAAESSRARLVPKPWPEAPRPPDPPLFAASPDQAISPLTTRSQSVASDIRFPIQPEMVAATSSTTDPAPREMQPMRSTIEESALIPTPISRLAISAMLTPTDRPSVEPSSSSTDVRPSQQGGHSRGEREIRPSASTPTLPSFQTRDTRMGGVSDSSAESPEAPTAVATSAQRAGADESSQRQQQQRGETQTQTSQPHYRPPSPK